AIGVVIGDDDGGVFPRVGLLEGVNHVYHERLLIKRIRISGVAVLRGFGLQESHGRQAVFKQRGPEVFQVVLMVGLIRLTNEFRVAGRKVIGIGRRFVILKRLMMRNVVARSAGRGQTCGYRAASGGTVGILASEPETALEPAPGDVLLGEQVTDIRPRHGDARLLGGSDPGVVRQLSKPGRGSPMTAPEFSPPARFPPALPAVTPSAAKGSMVAPLVSPETKLMAPGV